MSVGTVSTQRRFGPSSKATLLIIALGAAGSSTGVADSIAQGTSQVTAVESKASQAVKESAIVTKVKARLAARHLSTLVTVRVVTDEDGIVWLSGSVPTFDASAQAARIAMETEGVVAVHNAIVVR